MAVNHLLRAAIMHTGRSPRFAYLAPTYRQAKAVAWDYLKQFSGAIPGVKFHETELRADLPNGARLTLLGAENPDSLRGIYLDGCVMDEVADMPETVFPEIIRPALSDRKGFCYFIGTPVVIICFSSCMNRLVIWMIGIMLCIRHRKRRLWMMRN